MKLMAVFLAIDHLKSIDLPSSIVRLCIGCFDLCESLIIIIILNSVLSIGERCFYRCKALTEMTLPIIQKTIKKETFSGCSKLKQIILPQLMHLPNVFHFNKFFVLMSLGSIGHNCLAKRKSLKSIFILPSVH